MKIFSALLMTAIAALVLSRAISHQKYTYSETFRDGETIQNDISASAASNELCYKLGKEISSSNGGHNIVLSPYSIFSALVMVEMGTGKRTRAELISFLKWNVNTNQLKKISDLRNDLVMKGTEMKIANEIWTADKFQLLETFERNMVSYFGVKAGKEPFEKNPEKSREDINRWIAGQTNQMIKELFKSDVIDTSTVLVLANAVYFKGSWENPFDKESTKNEDFHLGDGKTIKVPFMFANMRIPHGKDSVSNVQLVELPYSGQSFSMVIAMPMNSNINEIFANMNQNTMERWRGLLKAHEHGEGNDIFMPKFKVVQNIELKSHLMQMGVHDVFTPGVADFSTMANQKMVLSNVVHEAYVQVDEEGTTAAGASGGVTGLMSMPEQIRIDRPFMFYIIHKKSNTIVFSGKVMNPNK